MTDDAGYARLRSALDEAHARSVINGSVRIERTMQEPWDLVTGDHVERDGRIHLGGGIVVDLDSTIVGSPDETVKWRGGHTMPDGERLERFLIAGRATRISWRAAA